MYRCQNLPPSPLRLPSCLPPRLLLLALHPPPLQCLLPLNSASLSPPLPHSSSSNRSIPEFPDTSPKLYKMAACRYRAPHKLLVSDPLVRFMSSREKFLA
eukprot:753942-Hanusia_phi.AAC.1